MAEIVIPNGDRIHLYAAAAAQRIFSYTFPILTTADLAVKRRRAGADTLLVLDVDYTVSGAGTQPGGSVTLAADSLAGDLIAIYGDETGERITDFLSQTFSNLDINAELDRIAQALLDLRRTVKRRVGISETDDGSISLTLPPAADRANALLGFSSTGAPEARLSSGTVMYVLTSVGPPAANVGATGDLALGTDGSVWSKASGSWVVTTVNLRGATGPAGSAGTLPDGTPAAPGLAFASDTNTGLHRVGADLAALVANGIIQVQWGVNGLEILGTGSGLVLPEHATAMATPAAGKLAVYGKTNGRPYAKNSDGREMPLTDIDPSVCDFRLTLTTGVPVMTADTTGTTLYVTPFNGNRIAIYNTAEAVWEIFTLNETSLALAGLTAGKNYDLFAYQSGGSVGFEMVVWTSDTARATAISFQNGVPVKFGDFTRRLVGTFRALSATQIEWKLGGAGAGGVAASLGLWHANPKVRQPVRGFIRDTTDSWSYGGIIRGANNSAAMRLSVLDGDGTLNAIAQYHAFLTGAASNQFLVSIGLDSTTAFSAYSNAQSTPNLAQAIPLVGGFYGPTGLGWHFLQALEGRLTGAGAATWFGDAGLPLLLQTGLAYEVMI